MEKRLPLNLAAFWDEKKEACHEDVQENGDLSDKTQQIYLDGGCCGEDTRGRIRSIAGRPAGCGLADLTARKIEFENITTEAVIVSTQPQF